ncbi:hypothetical protein FBULB1_800 [Fusarium bulbicola]|nr:hypothetical protein FBULB1_800 [Fusarium bulbicola]
MSLQEPSERERRMYYHGLPSGPKLIARSSTTPWNQPREWPDRKRLYVATGHAIQQPWNDPNGSLQRLIIATLDGIDWTAIDILRIGYESIGDDYRRVPERPVTMLISVSTNSTTFQEAEAAIVACKRILAQFNLDDVEVEIKESIVTTAASSPSSAPSDPTADRDPRRLHPGPFDNDIKYRYLRDISEYIGTPMGTPFPLRHYKEGSKGIYLHDSNGTAYVLTCRHVLFPPKDIDEYRYEDVHGTTDVLQPGGNSLNKLSALFRTKKEANDGSIEAFSKPLYNTPENQGEIQDGLRFQSVLQYCEPYLNQFDDEVCAVLGRVEFSPSVELSSNGRLKDWALVKLEQDSFTTKLTELRNKIPVTTTLRNLVDDVPVLPARRPLRLRFSSNEVAIGPALILESEQDDPGLVVLKHGKTTGFAVGRANGVHSVTRHVDTVGEVKSSEWCIIGMDDKAFSAGGDSGAVVFDLEGRVGGMITSGLEAGENPSGKHDVTYASTMEWLLEDMAGHGYDLKLPN